MRSFFRRALTESLLLVSGLVLTTGALTASSMETHPNILILMAEDMSARVGAFGDAVAVTPNLDTLAEQSTRYPNTFTTAGVCAPSRAAHITGMHQASIGAQHMRTSSAPTGGYRAVPPEEVKAYPELLRAAGYYTFTDSKLDYQFSGTLSGSGPFTIWSEEGSGSHWRHRKDGEPFYGLMNFSVTHESGVFQPLGTWPNSLTHFIMQVLRSVQSWSGAQVQARVSPAAVIVPAYFPDTPTVRADIARHYNNIAAMDVEVGAILAELQEDGLLDSTIVIWTTDHGDGLPRSKRELYDSGIQVPMLIRWPEAYRPATARRGSVDRRLISFVDLAPTILRLAGVSVPEYLHGHDILSGTPREYVYAARDRIDEVSDQQRAVRDERYKYIRSWFPQQGGGHRLVFRDNIDMMREMHALYEAGALNDVQRLWFEGPGEEQLYDLKNDPLELKNLAGQAAAHKQLTRLRTELADWQLRVSDGSSRLEVDMVAEFNPGGVVPVTKPPNITQKNGSVHIDASDNASIGYRIDEGQWRVYTTPVSVTRGAIIEARAVRYGWDESKAVTLNLKK